MTQYLLSDFRSQFEIRIAWGDMDAAQHVNNTMYLRYSESGRIKYMEEVGIDINQDSLGIILAEINCQYKFPLTYPDTIIVGTRVIINSIDEYNFWTEQIIVSKKTDRIAAVIKSRIVSYDYLNLKKVPWSSVHLDLISSFESK